MTLKKYGYHPTEQYDHETGIPARITAVHRELFEFVSDAGAGIAHLKGSEYYAGDETFPTVGDFVLLDYQEGSEGRILKTLPRRSYFSRLDPSSAGQREQAVAANFDYVFILQSLERGANLRSLERYLTLAWQSGATPVVVLTKADCAEDYMRWQHEVASLAIGVEVFATSARTGMGIAALREFLKPGNTIVLLGPSGAGKSTMLNTLAEETLMPTGEIRQKDGRGRHTTSHRQLILLQSGAMIIDTPGMRELGMWDVSRGLEKSFSDVEQYFGQCKFRDCRHQGEPGCAVKAAILRGELSLEHWESYLALNAEARFSSDKAGYLREKEQWHKSLSKQLRQMKKTDYRHSACTESFVCKSCGAPVSPESAGTKHRNHCPHCLKSVHVDKKSGDRASACQGIMDAVGIWVKKSGEWAIIHHCRDCGTLRANRIAADDNTKLLMSIAQHASENPPFPFEP